MPRFINTNVFSLVIIAFIFLPEFNAGGKPATDNSVFSQKKISVPSKEITKPGMEFFYDSLKLEEQGLKKDAFSYAYTGYKNLLEKRLLNKEGIITICDFSQSSKKKRLYVIDLKECKLLLNTYVAHGRNSGKEFAKKFSNNPESLQSSLGFYKTKKTYYGSHGLSLTLSGLENGFNDKAEKRKIVLHGSDYIGDNYLRFSRYMGRSFGCPAIPKKHVQKLINAIKNGSCLFIYHPTKNYLTGSKLLNG